VLNSLPFGNLNRCKINESRYRTRIAPDLQFVKGACGEDYLTDLGFAPIIPCIAIVTEMDPTRSHVKHDTLSGRALFSHLRHSLEKCRGVIDSVLKDWVSEENCPQHPTEQSLRMGEAYS
jgi:hypothetical protein